VKWEEQKEICEGKRRNRRDEWLESFTKKGIWKIDGIVHYNQWF
jgi:hypothetical protein